jgi:hypothetical protein
MMRGRHAGEGGGGVEEPIADRVGGIIGGRVCAEVAGEFVVFLIGMRINRPLKPWRWLPVVAAMPRMLAELARQPELGLLHARAQYGLRSVMMLQYWRSFAALEAYARARDRQHLPAWQAFHAAAGTGGDVGIWHETYVVKAGAYETIYVDMPRWGLGAAGVLREASDARREARGRMRG